jgi:hypothetical protein
MTKHVVALAAGVATAILFRFTIKKLLDPLLTPLKSAFIAG